MANPTSPTDSNGYRLGMLVHKVSTTLTAVLWRALAKASTSGATDVGWGGVATHLEDDVAVVADASNAKPVVLIAGQVGTHVTVGTGDVSALQADALGALRINAGTSTAAALADAFANPTTTHIAADQFNYNGTTWERQRSNIQATLLTSAARTTTQTGADTVNYNHRGIKVVIDVTTAGTGSITASIQEKDPTSGKYVEMLASAAIVTAITTILTIYPGLTAVANTTATQVLPRDFRIVITHNNANSITYSVGYALLV